MNRQKDLVSVIVPIYNVERYLERCIISICGQTYQNLEIILVDDGSPDKCGMICDQYAKKDKRIRVIHKENGGLSDARNAGIEISLGDYLVFIDSDDFVQDNFIERLYNLLQETEADISQCAFQSVEKQEQFVYEKEKTPKVKTRHEMLVSLYGTKHVEHKVIWNKMYRRKFFHTLRFPVGKIHEDEYTTYKIYDKIEKAVVTEEKLYGYFVDPNSITRQRYSIKRQDIIPALEERRKYFKTAGEEEIKRLTGEALADSLIYHGYCSRHFLKDENKEKELYKKFRKLYLEENRFMDSTMIRRLYYGMYDKIPWCFRLIFAIYQKGKR